MNDQFINQMETNYEKPVCEVISLEAEEGIMILGSGDAPKGPGVNTADSSEETNFWSR